MRVKGAKDGRRNRGETGRNRVRKPVKRHYERKPSVELKAQSQEALTNFFNAFVNRETCLDGVVKETVHQKLLKAYNKFPDQTTGGHFRLIDALEKATRVISNIKHGCWVILKKVIDAIKAKPPKRHG